MKKVLFVLTMGFALFSMHFGSGNLVYPLALGSTFGAASLPALLGFLVTAVGFPAVGFLSMVLFKGEPKVFFGRFGPLVATAAIGVIVGVMGPFGCLARCIALTHTITTHVYADLSLELFSLLSCLLIFCLCLKKSRIVSILGKVLTPILLLTLAAVMVGGLFSDKDLYFNFENSLSNSCQGLFLGYQTMDLLAALFFCHLLFKPIQAYAEAHKLSPFRLAFQTSCVASLLLILTYAGFGLLSATHAELLQNVPPEFLLIRLSEYVLGANGAILTVGLVVFTCLTTAMALAAIFADFLTIELRLAYGYSL
ncbi:MAG: branched-chain amino acid transport system II carrier protein, partial [Verrucomicrobia bacterium]|nr:branched-chain amino acid transport system II carrier protein [Verrucomicrobiota bacterium]